MKDYCKCPEKCKGQPCCEWHCSPAQDDGEHGWPKGEAPTHAPGCPNRKEPVIKQYRVRPHNDDPELIVVETRTYSGDADDLGELLDDDVVPAVRMDGIDLTDPVAQIAISKLFEGIRLLAERLRTTADEMDSGAINQYQGGGTRPRQGSTRVHSAPGPSFRGRFPVRNGRVSLPPDVA